VDVELNQYRVNKEVNIQDPSEDLGEPIVTENAKRSFGIRAHHVAVPLCVLSDKGRCGFGGRECIYDQGGYFINGSEKVIIAGAIE
jgi:DNA-directed RNA polymerase II subunit RPB2